MPSVSIASRVKTPNQPDAVDTRWSSLEDMSPAAWSAVQKRVSVCLYCLGPALLTDEEIEATIAEPLCRRCRAQVVAA